MGIDLDPHSDFHGTLRSWVKCARCSERLGRPYPVEAMGLEGGEESGQLSSKYKMIVSVECHGESMRCAIEVPRYWLPNLRMQALAYVYAFVKNGAGVYTAEIRRGTRGQSAGALITEVH